MLVLVISISGSHKLVSDLQTCLFSINYMYMYKVYNRGIYVYIPSFHLSVYTLHKAHLKEIILHTNVREGRERDRQRQRERGKRQRGRDRVRHTHTDKQTDRDERNRQK